MKALIFATQLDDTEAAVKDQLSGHRTELCTTVNRFARRLFELREEGTIAVLLPADEEELIDVYRVKDLFSEIPVMLVLPNRDKFTEAIGYRLKPRLMCHRESNITEAVSALKNLAGSAVHPRFGNRTMVY
ncbi:MAG TPA: hypothetical protein VMT71_15665, partial [Syntrophorhabdales bacterium]|nr:hypothetical protein [Syntrophorhabdales bacterium]